MSKGGQALGQLRDDARLRYAGDSEGGRIAASDHERRATAEAFGRDARQLRTRDVAVGDRSLLRGSGAVGAFEDECPGKELELAVPNGSGTFLPRDCVARLHRHTMGGVPGRGPRDRAKKMGPDVPSPADPKARRT